MCAELDSNNPSEEYFGRVIEFLDKEYDCSPERACMVACYDNIVEYGLPRVDGKGPWLRMKYSLRDNLIWFPAGSHITGLEKHTRYLPFRASPEKFAKQLEKVIARYFRSIKCQWTRKK